MVTLGHVRVKDFLEKVKGQVRGRIFTDGKDRYYAADYVWEEFGKGCLKIKRRDGTGDTLKLPFSITLDESLIAFFGLYSGDGSKGTDDPSVYGKLKTSISFSQREPHLVRFAVESFRRIFSNVHFVFSIGEDSAYFMGGRGLEELKLFYGKKLPKVPQLSEIKPELSEADKKYLKEKRPVKGNNEDYLSFYYTYNSGMQEVLKKYKQQDLSSVGISLEKKDRISASVRRPFKKGARVEGGTSRSDELYISGINGIGELFLKIMHELEQSILEDCRVSSQGLIEWTDKPSQTGSNIDIAEFFSDNLYGQIARERPRVVSRATTITGCWPRSKEIQLNRFVVLNPQWCYVAGLYLAEGSTPKSTLFTMFKERPTSLSIGFTSTENQSISLLLRTFNQLFAKEDCLTAWKVKVGSQYFPELVVNGLKDGVPMLRGGASGDGKLRTMEISLAIKQWALTLAPCLKQYESQFSHVEPTGAGIPRIDFWASSALARWYFPLAMYTLFRHIVEDPTGGFYS